MRLAPLEVSERALARLLTMRLAKAWLFTVALLPVNCRVPPLKVVEGATLLARAKMFVAEALAYPVAPIGSFTDPEYAQVGPTEAQARVRHDVVAGVVRFNSATRPIIDGRTRGFYKLLVDGATRQVLGCHIVGERAVDVCQAAALVIASKLTVDELARMPLSYPTYTGILGLAAARAAHTLHARPGSC